MKKSYRKNSGRNKRAATISRRDFLKYSGVAGGALLFCLQEDLIMASSKSRVAFVGSDDRKSGVSLSLKTLGINPVKNKDVLIKPNFNTADRTPGSTHNDTLVALVEAVWQMGAKSIRLGELDVEIIDFDDLDQKDWVKVEPEESHWQDGFRVARPILEAECLVSTCCLKTHQFGGVFTMSLKLHVGVVPTSRHGYSYMSELHQSPQQRKLIAEINAPFKPDLVVLDGIDAFVDGGPADGKRAKANAFLAATDRVAIDAVGLAILKYLGSNAQIMNKKIFEQEQIARAAEIGLGAASPSEIEVVAANDESQKYRDAVVEILSKG
jgi:uncharacterized protein (DUF362 family)